MHKEKTQDSQGQGGPAPRSHRFYQAGEDQPSHQFPDPLPRAPSWTLLLPEYRGRGVARSLVTRLANGELENGNRVELLCKSDSIVDFYKSIGFTVTNEWSLITDGTKLF